MAAVILMMVPLTIPRLMGIKIYGVMTGSMEPAYSVGGVVYVKSCDASKISEGDVITFRLGTDTEAVMTHRVLQMDGSFFITKGDANNTEDPEPVSYDRLIGRVVFFIPKLAGLANFVDSATGRYFFILLFALSLILWITGDLLKNSRKETKQEKNSSGQAENRPGQTENSPGQTENRTVQTADMPEAKKGRGTAHRKASLVTVLGILLIFASVAYLGMVFYRYYASDKEYRELEQQVFGTGAGQQTNASEETGAQDGKLTAEDQEILQALKDLQQENADVIGWIRFDNLDVSYPVMQCEDNEFYLKHTFKKESNPAGSIFREAANTRDFEDCHTILYGHNMKNLSMFGILKKYKTENFYEENPYFTIYTTEHVYRYQIFAYYDIAMDADLYTIGFKPDEVFQDFVEKMRRRSYYDTGVDVNEKDKVLTLSTCSTKGNRFVVNAKRIESR